MLALLGRLQVLHGGPQPFGDGQVGGEDEGGEEGNEHGRRAQGRDGLHVGSHHAGDEAHGQQGGDDGKGGEDGGVAHLRHGLHGDIVASVALFQPAAVDVLHHDDGVIHQDANGEDESEEAHPVNGVIPNPGDEDGHQQHDGNDQHDHDGRTQGTEGGPDQQEDPAGGDEELEDQFADLVVGRLAVVTGDADLDIVGDTCPLQLLDLGHDGVGDTDTVGQLLLGHCDGDARHPIGLETLGGRYARVTSYQLGSILRALGDDRHVPDIDGLAVVGPHHQATDIVHALEEGTGGDRKVRATGLDPPGIGLGVRGLDRLSDLIETDFITGQAFRLDIHRDLLAAATDDKGISGISDLLEGLKHVLGQQP